MLTLDGAQGEGGGQILRTSLALSLATRTPFRMTRIRAGRRRPGLLRQHLTAVRAARKVGAARVTGAELGSTELVFEPRDVRPGSYELAVGTAGSACLVLQTVLLPLLTAADATTLVIEGGTHNPFAPPFDFLERAFLPQLERMGARVRARLERPGFYPAGGGRVRVEVEPVRSLEPLSLLERGPILRHRAVAMVARLPRAVGERELRRVRDELGWPESELEVVAVESSAGPGNVVILDAVAREVTEVVTGFGEAGVRAELVADRAVEEMRRYLSSGAPVGRHLADQLLLPLALAGGGAFRTPPLSRHAATDVEIIGEFLPVAVTVTSCDGGRVQVDVGAA